MRNDTQENLIYRYLLGELPEPEQAALEERFFADNETFEQVCESENRLVDRYVRGRLSSADRARFEAHYLASPAHRQRVATARRLLAAADEFAQSHSAPETRPSFFQRLIEWRRLAPAWQLAMAAGMLLLMAGGAWLLVERTRLSGELANLQKENAARQNRERELARQIASGQSERERLSAELEQLRKQQTQARTTQSPTPQSVLTIFSFALSPISVRGSAAQPLAVGPDADQVQLQLTVPPGDWQSFEVSIKSLGGQPFRSQQQLKSRAGKVIVTVPAAKLPFNDYILTLSGAGRVGKTEEINQYSFRVIRE
jgi:anti-sigma factor RsiW